MPTMLHLQKSVWGGIHASDNEGGAGWVTTRQGNMIYSSARNVGRKWRLDHWRTNKRPIMARDRTPSGYMHHYLQRSNRCAGSLSLECLGQWYFQSRDAGCGGGGGGLTSISNLQIQFIHRHVRYTIEISTPAVQNLTCFTYGQQWTTDTQPPPYVRWGHIGNSRGWWRRRQERGVR